RQRPRAYTERFCECCKRLAGATSTKHRRISGEWCARVESNHHSFRNTDLNRARLPIPPRAPMDRPAGDKPALMRCQPARPLPCFALARDAPGRLRLAQDRRIVLGLGKRYAMDALAKIKSEMLPLDRKSVV